IRYPRRSPATHTTKLLPLPGVGKGTLIELLRQKYPTHFGFSVSHTTRQPREGEENGVHYNFTTVETMKKEIDEGKFVEYAEVHGNYYGTSIEAVETVRSKGKICILDIDVQGVRNVKKSTLDAIYVFVAPPSMEELEKRLRGRGTESEEAVLKRLGNAKEELDYGMGEGNFDRVFTNDDLQQTFASMVEQFTVRSVELTGIIISIFLYNDLYHPCLMDILLDVIMT
ncbi:hypothetical protein ACHAXS_005276, partial [Conticribra weissflogii]